MQNLETETVMTPQRFFTQALPQLAQQHASVFANLKGDVVFAIANQGAWTVQLGNAEAPVLEGDKEDADLSMFFTDEAFAALMKNELDFEQAIERKAVGFRGDLSLLEKLGFLLSAKSNADSVQVSQVPMGVKRV